MPLHFGKIEFKPAQKNEAGTRDGLAQKNAAAARLGALAKICISIFLSVCALSCNYNLFPELKVRDAFIDGEKAVVEFSAPPSISSAREKFLFLEDGIESPGKLLCAGNRIEFFPYNKITKNHSYKITVYSGIEDTDGNTLQEDFNKVLFTKTDLTAPEVLSVDRENDGGGSLGAIKINFSKRIDAESFRKNFSIEPSADFFIIWENGNESARIQFNEILTEKILYSAKISSGLCDAFNNKMKNDYYFSFEKNENYIMPECTGLLDDAANFPEEVTIVFNKSLDADKVISGIKIEPKISYKAVPLLGESGNYCSRMKIVFNESVKWNSEYLLCVENIADDYGSRTEEKRFVLKNNAERLRPPELEFLLLQTLSENVIISREKNFPPVNFRMQEGFYPKGQKVSLPLFAVFSVSRDSDCIESISAAEALSINPNSSAGILLLRTEALDSEIFSEQFPCAELESMNSAEKKIAVIKYTLSFENKEFNDLPACGLIEFNFSNKICDNNKNYMEDSIRLTCCKN